MGLELEQFNPTVAELTDLVQGAKLLSLPDYKDEEQVKVVKEMRIKLRDARVVVEKTGKSLREDALKFQKAVISREKELIAIVEPEEERLKGLEDEAKRLLARDARVASLPARMERLKAIEVEVGEEGILDLDDEQFEAFYNKCSIDRNERKERELAEREAAVKAAEEAQKRETEMKEREETARKEAEARAAREVEEAKARAFAAEKAAAEAKERAEKEASEKAERERIAREKAEAEEKARLEKETRYQMFLDAHGYNEETKDKFHIARSGNVVRLYMLTGELNLD